MTNDDRFLQELHRYLDDFEGPTPLPETVRSTVRAELPRTKQIGPGFGPMRYLTMTMNKAAPMALVAAAAILAIAVGTFLFTRQDVGSDDPSPSLPAASTAASPEPESAAPSPSEVAACASSTARMADADTLEVVWCPIRDGEPVQLSFTMQAAAEWIDQWYGAFESLWLRPESGGAIAFVLHEGQSVEQLVAEIQGRDGYVVADEATASVGGAAGVVFDVSLEPGTDTTDALPLFETTELDWNVQEDEPTRVWVIDHDGQTMLIATRQPLADDLGASLDTLEWQP
jgi:hypothetical protein